MDAPEDLGNFLVAGDGIKQRIIDTMMTAPTAVLRNVAGVEELSAIQENSQVVPAAYVVYMGFQVPEAAEYSASFEHHWIVSIAVRTPAGGRDPQPRNYEAGLLVDRAMKALCGFVPAPNHTALVPATPPPVFYASPFMYVPLLFKTVEAVCFDPIY